jgi:hypothetical protein
VARELAKRSFGLQRPDVMHRLASTQYQPTAGRFTKHIQGRYWRLFHPNLNTSLNLNDRDETGASSCLQGRDYTVASSA